MLPVGQGVTFTSLPGLLHVPAAVGMGQAGPVCPILVRLPPSPLPPPAPLGYREGCVRCLLADTFYSKEDMKKP